MIDKLYNIDYTLKYDGEVFIIRTMFVILLNNTFRFLGKITHLYMINKNYTCWKNYDCVICGLYREQIN